MAKHSKPIPFAAVESRIHLIRGNKVMLDADLAQLYGVATKNLNKAVARNRARFPEDFMFQLAAQELADLRFQIGTSNQRGGQRYLPYAFTQEGIAMPIKLTEKGREWKETKGRAQRASWWLDQNSAGSFDEIGC